MVKIGRSLNVKWLKEEKIGPKTVKNKTKWFMNDPKAASLPMYGTRPTMNIYAQLSWLFLSSNYGESQPGSKLIMYSLSPRPTLQQTNQSCFSKSGQTKAIQTRFMLYSLAYFFMIS